MGARNIARQCVFCPREVEQLRVVQLDAHCCGSCASQGRIVRHCKCGELVEQERIKLLDSNSCAKCAHSKETNGGGIKTVLQGVRKRIADQLDLFRQNDNHRVIVPLSDPPKRRSKPAEHKHPPVLETVIED